MLDMVLAIGWMWMYRVNFLESAVCVTATCVCMWGGAAIIVILSSAGLKSVEAPGQQYYRKDFYTMAK